MSHPNPLQDTVVPLPYVRYSYTQRCWTNGPSKPKQLRIEDLPSHIGLVTWNVDMSWSDTPGRLWCALNFLQGEIFKCPQGTMPRPCAVLLQEVAPAAFAALLAHPWVCAQFYVLPPGPGFWPPGATYGAVTLVSRNLRVARGLAVAYGGSRMQRTALVTDVLVGVGAGPARQARALRIVNTHLESLAAGAEQRAQQLWTLARWLHDREVVGAVAGGDMNAIAPTDDAHVRRNRLRDAWDDVPARSRGYGATWGFQSRRKTDVQHAPGRLDKFLYRPGSAFKIAGPWIIGEGLRTAGGEWVSDHYGLVCRVNMEGDDGAAGAEG
ncbi:hypothetical protein DENSPDRAFT_769258 [Dentipellis sp. KUC8613]|nr:hypothetical protein DENSPDRAFT_769258 [Dentipellis sp. KUC8613]